MPRRAGWRVPLAAALAALTTPLALSASADARMSIVYGPDEGASRLLSPDRPDALRTADGAHRQEPSGSGAFLGPDGRDMHIAKVTSEELRDLSADAMAALLRERVDMGCGDFDCGSHLVAVDEIGPEFSDGAVEIRYRDVSLGGETYRIAEWNDIEPTDEGWEIVRRTPPLPTVDPESPGSRLSRAMRALDATPSPYGGSYAERVHLYIAPAFVTSIGLGQGAHRTLGRDGLPHRRGWRGVMPALSLAGGVWLEMYHGGPDGRPGPFSRAEWLAVPESLSGYYVRFGGDPRRLHFMIAETEAPPPGSSGCGSAMSCQWILADRPGAAQRILRNGAGAFGVGSQAGEWLANHVARVRNQPELDWPSTPEEDATSGDAPRQTSERRRRAPLTLSARQLRINQRIAQTALRRVAALESRIVGRPTPSTRTSARGGVLTLSTRQLLINQRISQAAVRRVNALQGTGTDASSRAGRTGPVSVSLSTRQLRINQRVSQAALLRVRAMEKRFSG